MSIQLAPWMQAVEAQISAAEAMDWLIKREIFHEASPQWKQSRGLLGSADPYDWGSDATNAVWTASKALPLDAVLNFWNLPTGISWWYFTNPLPIITTHNKDLPVRAVLIGWLGHAPKRVFPKGTSFVEVENELIRNRSFSINCFTDNKEHTLVRTRVFPSQIYTWAENETLEQMLQRVSIEHKTLYGPGGILHTKKSIGHEAFMEATESISRFILAALSWVRQRVVVQTEAHIERHRRKDFERKTSNTARAVQIIQLRRAEHKPKDREETEEEKAHREWSCRWMVGVDTNGFWRNQACGTGMKDRRLTYIAPYMKGPDDKPLKVSQPKVYVVNR